MIFLGVLCSCFVIALARPEPPSFGGYSSSAPSGGLDTYSAPLAGGAGDGYSAPSSGYSAPSSGYSAPSSGYSAPSSGYSAPSSQYGAPAAAPVIHKHVYVHVPPPEAPSYAPRKSYPQPVPRKHYKIVFIKAPTPPTPTVPDIPAPVQDEQKTLIYVLVKRPEEQPDIHIPTPAPTKPSKPEVYFIRYRTQKDQGGYPDSGVPASSYGAPSSSGPSSSYGAPSAGGY